MRTGRDEAATVTIDGEPVSRGQAVWSRSREYSYVFGLLHSARHGHPGYLGRSRRLRLEPARKELRCGDCGAAVARGELHGRSLCHHLCRACLLPHEPEPVFTDVWPGEHCG